MSNDRRVEERLNDREAFLAFYDRTFTDAYRYAGRLCGTDRAAAEDLVQDAYLRVLRQIRGGDGPQVSVGYVITTIRNLHLDGLRREAGRERHLHLVATPAASIDADPPSMAEPSALAALPTRDRTALVLRYVDGLSVPEVADALGTTVHAAESLLARARTRLRQQEADHG